MNKGWFILVILLFTYIFSNISYVQADSFSDINKQLNIECIEDEKEKQNIFNALLTELEKESIEDTAEKLGWSKKPFKNGEYYKIYWLRDNIRKYS